MIARRRREEVRNEPLNMTPMIDVVFQLLIFFMLTMQFKEVEGKLLSQLPRHGTDISPAPALLDEVRITVRTGADTALCRVNVEAVDVGELARSEARPAALAPNRAVYRAAAERARDFLEGGVGRSRRVVLDADGAVAYEHVIGLVDALKGAKIDAVEFVADPRFQKSR